MDVYEEYAITMKFNGTEEPDIFMYENLLKRWKRLDVHVPLRMYERDSHGRLHLHGLVRMPKNFWRGKLHSKNLHYKISSIFNRERWIRYCKKNQINRK